MDGTEEMTIPAGSVAYYMQQRGLSSIGAQPGFHGQAGIHPLSNSDYILQSHISTGVSVYPVESSVTTNISPGGVGMAIPSGTGSGSEPVKRKRGRPRKYWPDGTVALALPLPSTPQTSVTPVQKRGRGRPPGSGKKQQLTPWGEWGTGSAGMGFTPHVITVSVGEDIASKVMSFSQQGPRGVCIMSATGSVSSVSLRQTSTSCGTVTYEGRFEIISLSGSYLSSEDGGTCSQTGGLSVSLASPDGRVIGGSVAGRLIASSPIQVIVGSFSYGIRKVHPKQGTVDHVQQSVVNANVGMLDKPGTSTGAIHYQNPGIVPPAGWPRTMDVSNSHRDIDLTSG